MGTIQSVKDRVDAALHGEKPLHISDGDWQVLQWRFRERLPLKEIANRIGRSVSVARERQERSYEELAYFVVPIGSKLRLLRMPPQCVKVQSRDGQLQFHHGSKTISLWLDEPAVFRWFDGTIEEGQEVIGIENTEVQVLDQE